MKGLDDLKSGPQPTPEQAELDAADDTARGLVQTPGVDPRNLDMLEVGRAVGLNDLESVKKNSVRLDRLMAWAKLVGAKDQLGMVVELKSLIHRLGSPTIHDLYVYTRLDMDRRESEAKMRKMEPSHAAR